MLPVNRQLPFMPGCVRVWHGLNGCNCVDILSGQSMFASSANYMLLVPFIRLQFRIDVYSIVSNDIQYFALMSVNCNIFLIVADPHALYSVQSSFFSDCNFKNDTIYKIHVIIRMLNITFPGVVTAFLVKHQPVPVQPRTSYGPCRRSPVCESGRRHIGAI